VFFDFAVADRIVMIVSRLLGAAAACVISFFCKWQISKILEWLHEGCDCDLSADFSILALVFFLVKFLLKSVSKSFFFCFGTEVHPVLGLQFVLSLCIRKFLCVIFFSVRACCV
jgi:hypothetical protein